MLKKKEITLPMYFHEEQMHYETTFRSAGCLSLSNLAITQIVSMQQEYIVLANQLQIDKEMVKL